MSKEVVKNTKCNKLNTKVNNLERKILDATTWIQIYQYNTDKQYLEEKIGDVDKKIPDVSGLVTTKIGEFGIKIPDPSSLVTTTVLNKKIKEGKSKIPDASGLIKKTNFDAKISEIKKKYCTTFDYNKFTKKIFNEKIKENKLVDRSDISNLVKNSDLSIKLATLATKAELKVMQDKIVKLQSIWFKILLWQN